MTLSKGWKRTIDEGFEDAAAWAHLGTVTTELADYNTRLATTPGYAPADWRLLMAMVWAESGGPKCVAWKGRAMQIGNPHDKGYPALKKHDGATEIVVRPELLKAIDVAGDKDIGKPKLNVQAGIAYLFVRMAQSEIASLPDAADTVLHDHTVRNKDNASSIAHQEGTTIEELKADNPGDVARLSVGEVLHFHKAHHGRTITGWLPFTPEVVAKRYNVGGDPDYAEKVKYVLGKLKWESPE
jgi:hypothetical protein